MPFGTQVAKLFTEIGQRVPLHCTAVGKVLLAGGPGEDDLVRDLTLAAFTPRTITSRRALQRELAAIRAAGFAMDREEHELGGPAWRPRCATHRGRWWRQSASQGRAAACCPP